jgi:hypothetical protein
MVDYAGEPNINKRAPNSSKGRGPEKGQNRLPYFEDGGRSHEPKNVGSL